MKRIAFAVPGDLATPTGGYGYNRRIIAELQVLGWQIDVVSVGDGFPQPSAEQRAVALALLEQLPKGTPVVVDGLALGALPEAAEKIARRAPLIALVHHPLALEAGLSSADAHKLFESERKALAAARSVIVTSRATAKRLNADYGVPRAHHRRAARHRSRSTRQRKCRRHSPAFVGRGRRAAQGLRRFDRCTRVDPRCRGG